MILSAGFTGLVLENFGDAPFVSGSVEPHIVSYMTLLAVELRREFGQSFELGINVLRNDARSAIAIATASEASFVRINVHIGASWTDQGLIQGQAYQTLMYKRQLRSEVQIAADVMVKHASPAGSTDLIVMAKDTCLRGGADVLILTGEQTGKKTDVNQVKEVRQALPQVPVWIGSGVTPQNIHSYKDIASGAIIGSYLHEDGVLDNPLSKTRAREFLLPI